MKIRVHPWLKLHWSRALLCGSVLFFAFHYVTGAVVNEFNSDSIIPTVLYRAVVEHGRSMQGWTWGGATFLFPDLTLVWLLNYLTGDGLAAIGFASAMFFLAWIVSVAAVYLASGGRKPDVLAGFVVLLAVILASQGGLRQSIGNFLFLPVIHGGSTIIALAWLAASASALSRGRRPGPVTWLMCGLLLLTVCSDVLLVASFVLPALAALGFTAFMDREKRWNALVTGALIFFSSVAGVLLSPFLFPVPTAPGYTGFNPSGAMNSIKEIGQELCSFPNPSRVVIILLSAATFLFCAGILLSRHGRTEACKVMSGWKFLLAFSAASILASWGAGILTGDYEDIRCVRYLSLALTLPFILVIFQLSELGEWRAGKIRALQAAVAITAICAAMIQPEPETGYTNARLAIPLIRKIMKREQVRYGLADYWYAPMVTYFSGGTVVLRAITPEGVAYHWFNNIHDFTGWEKDGESPAFRAIFTRHLQTDAIQSRFGPPAKVIPVLPGACMWVYSPEDAITYSPLFNELVNRHQFPSPTQFHSDAVELPSATGKIENHSIVARTGRDKEGSLTYGPYIHPLPGRYRVDFAYAYEKPPEPGKECRYDCNLTTPGKEIRLDEGPLPWTGDPRPAALTKWITIPPLKANVENCYFEARTFFRGSGDVRIDSLTITRAGP